ncbi:hypothetical protein GBF38_003580, partial [Nibea albiflora]
MQPHTGLERKEVRKGKRRGEERLTPPLCLRLIIESRQPGRLTRACHLHARRDKRQTDGEEEDGRGRRLNF